MSSGLSVGPVVACFGVAGASAAGLGSECCTGGTVIGWGLLLSCAGAVGLPINATGVSPALGGALIDGLTAASAYPTAAPLQVWEPNLRCPLETAPIHPCLSTLSAFTSFLLVGVGGG